MLCGGSSNAPLPVGWGSQVGQTWLQPRPEALWKCTSVKVAEILKDTEWGITGHLGAPVPQPQGNEWWKQSAYGPPFGTGTTYWLYLDLTFNLTGLTLVMTPLTAGLGDHDVPLSALSALLALSNAASPPHYCNQFPRIRSQRHALCSRWRSWNL